MTRILFLTWIALSVATPLQAQACHSSEAVAVKAKSVRTNLLGFNVDADAMGDDVSPEVSKNIASFKELLASAVDATVACASERGASIEPEAFENRLSLLLDANKPEKPFQPGAEIVDQIYGADLKIIVKKPKNIPDVLTVVLSFGIDCGQDTLLLVYEVKNGKWTRALLWKSDPYDSIGKAFGDMFEYTFVPARKSDADSWLIAVAHGHPWCTSRYSGFDIDLLNPAAPNQPQRVLWHLNEGYIRGDFKNRIRTTADGFELRVEVGTIESKKMTKPGIFRYRIEGDKVTREQPIAYNGRDFVDEWLQADWNDAKEWAATDGLEALKRRHYLFSERYRDEKNTVTYSYGPVTACGDKQQFQVEIDSDPGGPSYYNIRQESNGFTMLSVANAATAGCKGRDLMAGK